MTLACRGPAESTAVWQGEYSPKESLSSGGRAEIAETGYVYALAKASPFFQVSGGIMISFGEIFCLLFLNDWNSVDVVLSDITQFFSR